MPPLQRRKHPRFRKPESKSGKKRKKEVIRKRESGKILENLYILPLDVKEKIFQIAIISNMLEWSMDHMKKSSFSMLFSPQFIKENPNITLYPHSSDGLAAVGLHDRPNLPIFNCIPICERNVKISLQPGIKGVYIRDYWHHDIAWREWSNIENKYWYHIKCRCITCDRVRYIGMDNLPLKEKKRFENIVWYPSSKQWKPKSNAQLRYQKKFPSCDREIMKQLYGSI
tara:strand:+ start:1530 stop:2210 length:681 start_codon:yes stop_codon:yes gene_type:complete